MRIFDPHIHMTSRTTDDYEAMYAAGVRAVVEPAFWLGQPRTSPASFYDYFDALLGWEPFRAAQYGIAHHCTIALNPKEANDPRCVPVLDELPRYLVKDHVVAVGEIGYDSMTPAEDTALAVQLQLAAEYALPALVHTPHRDKLAGLRRTLDVVRESALPLDHVLIDHLNETTVQEAKDAGCWLGFSVYPDTKMDEERMVAVLREYGPEKVLVNSAADWGKSDPLKTRKVADALLAAGFTEDDVDRVLWRNPVAFYGLSGRLELDVAGTDATHEGNSILRGVPKTAPEDTPQETPQDGPAGSTGPDRPDGPNGSAGPESGPGTGPGAAPRRDSGADAARPARADRPSFPATAEA